MNLSNWEQITSVHAALYHHYIGVNTTPYPRNMKKQTVEQVNFKYNDVKQYN